MALKLPVDHEHDWMIQFVVDAVSAYSKPMGAYKPQSEWIKQQADAIRWLEAQRQFKEA